MTADGATESSVATRINRLSPSRASDFTTCPLLFRFRTIDRLPEPPTAATARGTLVHLVLERLFDAAAQERSLDAAQTLIEQAWSDLQARNPEYAEVVSHMTPQEWLNGCMEHVRTYFSLEDPRSVEPSKREEPVQFEVTEQLTLRGYVDRIDESADGSLVIIDYKTGKAPPPAFEAKTLFQMKFYALVLWRMYGQIPTRLRLMFLGDGSVLEYSPDEDDLNATQRKILALWDAIKRCADTGVFPPRPSALCRTCNHHAHCPEQGGTLPPLPAS